MEYWVQVAWGIFSILGSIVFLVMCVTLGYVIRLLLALQVQMKSLSERVHSITGRVDRMAKDIQYFTEEATVRGTGLMKMTDETVGRNLPRIEKVVVWVAAGMILRKIIKKIRH
jgi:sensor domain CHASE-containing protein